MNRLLALFAFAVLAAPFCLAQNDIVSQTQQVLNTNIVGSDQTVTSTELASSQIVQSIAGSIRSDQICVSLGDFRNDPKWQQSPIGESITYTGNVRQELDFFVLCEAGYKMNEAIEFYPGNQVTNRFVDHCPQINESNREVMCAVILTKSAPVPTEGFTVSHQLFFIFLILVIIPLFSLFKAENINLRIFGVIKLVFLVAIFVVFYVLGLILSNVIAVLFLFFFFVQLNLTAAPIVLGLADEESHFTRLMLHLIGILEAMGLLVAIIVIAPFL